MLFHQENSAGLGQVSGEVRGVSIHGGFQALAGQSLSWCAQELVLLPVGGWIRDPQGPI